MRPAMAFPLSITIFAALHHGAHGQDDDRKWAEVIGHAAPGLQSADPATRARSAVLLQNTGDVRGLRALRETLNFEEAGSVRKIIEGAMERIRKSSTTFGRNSVIFRATGTRVTLMNDGTVEIQGEHPGGTGSVSTKFERMGPNSALRILKAYCKGQKQIPPGKVETLKHWFLEVAIPYLSKFERPQHTPQGLPVKPLTEGAPVFTLCRTASADSAEIELYANGAVVYYGENGKGTRTGRDLDNLKDSLDPSKCTEEEKDWFENKAYPKLKELSEKLPRPK